MAGAGRGWARGKPLRRGSFFMSVMAQKFLLLCFLCLGAWLPARAGEESARALPRVVSLSPSLTEIIFSLGRGDALVGRSTACDFPPETAKLPAAGDFSRPFVEKILTLRPDLVVSTCFSDPASAAVLRRNKIEVRGLADATLGDYRKILEYFGEVLDCREAAAKEAARAEKLLRPLPGAEEKPRPRVLVLLSEKPLVTAGRKSFVHEMITAAGGENIAGAEDKSYFPCSLEWIIRQRPEIIVIPAMAPARAGKLAQTPGWRDLPAVRDGRVYVDCNPDWLCRLGPRVFDGIGWLREKIGTKP